MITRLQLQAGLSDAEVYCAPPVVRWPRHGNVCTVVRL